MLLQEKKFNDSENSESNDSALNDFLSLQKAVCQNRANPFYVAGTEISGNPVPTIMGIVNNTPDSFFDGGRYHSEDLAFEHALDLLEAGATIIDVGGESSRPGSQVVDAEEEIRRVVPIIKRLSALTSQKTFFISIDTVKSQTAKAALDAGAHIVNDISALSMDKKMPKLIRDSGASAILNHIRGNFGTMQQDFKPYTNVVEEVQAELLQAANRLLDLGVAVNTICLDPGIGFGKTGKDNLDLILHTENFVQTGFPVLYGMSRKSYIGKIRGLERSDRLIPTIVSGILAALGGVTVLRVHDVKETFESLALLEAFRNNGSVLAV